MRRMNSFAIALVSVITVFLGINSKAQNSTVEDGVFTLEQAASGKIVYEARCENCHAMKEYAAMLKSWQGDPLIDFWYNILGNMPADNPGSLMDAEYTDVIAYILSENGFPSGDVALDPINGMEQISIVAP